jgi:hypothetical protein
MVAFFSAADEDLFGGGQDGRSFLLETLLFGGGHCGSLAKILFQL